MKRVFIYTVLLLGMVVMAAEELAAQSYIARSEFIVYDRRDDAKHDTRTNIDKYIAMNPTFLFEENEGKVNAAYSQTFIVPAEWNDYNAYLHVENSGADYTVFVNGKEVATLDQFTPTDLYISPFLLQGENVVAFAVVDESYMALLDESLVQPARTPFSESYIFAQRRLAIYDFHVRLLPDPVNDYAMLDLNVVVDNSFETEETVSIGYDIYSPEGNLMEYSVNEITMAPMSRDTLVFKPFIYHSNVNRWSEKNPQLYSLTLYVKRDGIVREYIPAKVGFAKHGYNDAGQITLFDQPLQLSRKEYNAAVDRATTEKEIRALKSSGVNCLMPSYPQPKWFYDICDKMGVYVIDCAAISSPTNSDNRDVEGTPANAPWLLDEYLRRVDCMYRRAQNHVSIIAFRLGNANSGNGYNMYKAYELLKSYGDSRPIIYEGNDGEWNSDIDL